MIQRSESDKSIVKERIISFNGKDSFKASSSTSWSKLNDPRIVRVSRAFGGKDRHSKVCTVKGLRDRRVRLSVPTAIQLYDLQDKLGLNQPSKVVDWLLDAAKHEIDELPPLQIPQGLFTQTSRLLHHQNLATVIDFAASSSRISGSSNRERSHEHHLEAAEKKHINMENPFCRWDPSQLTASQARRSCHGMIMEEDLNSSSFVPSMPPPPLGCQLLLHPPAEMITQPSYLPPLRPFHFTMAVNHLPSENNAEVDHDNKILR